MKKTCRNCKWAKWQRSSNGRRLFGNYAECTFPVNLVLPASRKKVEYELRRSVSVWRYDTEEVDCATWEKE